MVIQKRGLGTSVYFVLLFFILFSVYFQFHEITGRANTGVSTNGTVKIFINSTGVGGAGFGPGGGQQPTGERVEPGIIERKARLYGFTFYPSFFDLQVKQGESLVKQLSVTSIGSLPLTVRLNASAFMTLTKREVHLPPHASESLQVYFDTEDTGIFLGKITGISEGVQKEVPAVLKVASPQFGFLVTLEIPTAFKEIPEAGKLLARVTLSKIIASTSFDLKYTVYDADGTIITQEREVLATSKDVQFDKTLAIPKDIREGAYLLVLEARYQDMVGYASAFFTVGTTPQLELPVYFNTPRSNFIFFVIIFLLLLAYFVNILGKKNRKRYKL